MRIGLLALLLVLLLGSGVGRAAQDDTLRIGAEEGLRTLDPHVAATAMELHVAEACFEGLTRIDADTLEPEPGLAASWTVSEDRLHWRFQLREGLTWSDGTALTARDVARGIRRALDPATGAEFAFMLGAIDGARALTEYGRAVLALAGPRGLVASLRRWTAKHPEGADPETWMRWIGQDALPRVLLESSSQLVRDAVRGRHVPWSADELAALATRLDEEQANLRAKHVEAAATVGRTRGVVAEGERALRIDLVRPVPDLARVLALPVAAPVPPRAHETRKTKGASAARRAATRWWREEEVPVCGPYRIVARTRAPDADGFGVVLERNPRYHDADAARQRRIEVVVVPDPKESLRLFTEGRLDWATSWPREVTPQLARTEFMRSADANVSYFLLLRTPHPALRDVRVRRALAKAVDRAALLETLPGLLARPADTIVPPGLPGYASPDAGLGFDPEAARALLTVALPTGAESLPPIELLYNATELNRDIASFVAAQWRTHLGVRAQPVGVTWFDYGVRRRLGRFAVARAGWVGDRPDPLAFLALFETGAEQNDTGWSSAPYDALLRAARETGDAAERQAALGKAEALLLREGVPCVPLFWYRHGDLVQPGLRGFRTHAVGAAPDRPGPPNVQGLHPLRALWKATE